MRIPSAMAKYFKRKKLGVLLLEIILLMVITIILIDVPQTLYYKLNSKNNPQGRKRSNLSNKKDSSSISSSTSSTPSSRNDDDKARPPCSSSKRLSRVDRLCSAQRDQGEPVCDPWTIHKNLITRQILVDDDNKVLYCEVPKAACSSWKSVFLMLTGKVKAKDLQKNYLLAHQTKLFKKVGLRYLHTYTMPQQWHRIENYFKFMVVRHPFERISSAYKDKVLETEWYHKYLGKWIMRHYRKNPDKYALDTGHNVTFKEFVQFITNKQELKVYQLHDPHWSSAASLCCPCLFKYDYIAKVETMEQDAKYLLSKILPQNQANITLPFSHVLHGNKASDVTKERLSTLPVGLRQKLDDHFEDDLEYFDYSMSDDEQTECGLQEGCC